MDMPEVELLSLGLLWKLCASPQSLYLVGYAWLFGMSLWVSFFGGIIAVKTLPRVHFRSLQHKTFPIYFSLSTILSSALIVLWIAFHPNVLSNINRPEVADVAQVYVLASVVVGQGSNYFLFGPMMSRVMFQCLRMEKEEGKTHDEPGASAALKSLNRKFQVIHGIGSLVNPGAFIAIGFHGLWIGHAGVKGH